MRVSLCVPSYNRVYFPVGISFVKFSSIIYFENNRELYKSRKNNAGIVGKEYGPYGISMRTNFLTGLKILACTAIAIFCCC